MDEKVRVAGSGDCPSQAPSYAQVGRAGGGGWHGLCRHARSGRRWRCVGGSPGVASRSGIGEVCGIRPQGPRTPDLDIIYLGGCAHIGDVEKLPFFERICTRDDGVGERV